GGAMFWTIFAHLAAVLLASFTAHRQLERPKDFAIAVLRHYLRMVDRRQPHPRLSRLEQLTLTLLRRRSRAVWRRARARAGPGVWCWSPRKRCATGTASCYGTNGP